MIKYSTIITGLLVAIGISVLGFCIKAGFDTFSSRDRVVNVRGLAEKEVSANKVTWPIVYKEVGNELPELYDRIQQTNNAILSYLKNNGISDNEISVNAPNIVDLQADRYSSQQNIPFRYNVTSVIVVVSSKIDKVRNLINRQGELLKQGIAITAGDYNYPTIYEYTDLNSVKPGMIAEATAKAREAGDKFAVDSHSSLGRIKSASQGQFSIEDRDPYTPFIKKIRVVSTIEYYLED